MSRQKRIKDVLNKIDEALSLNFDILYSNNPSTNPYGNFSPEDIESLVDDTMKVLEGISKSPKVLDDLSADYLVRILQQLDGLVPQMKAINSIDPSQLRGQHHKPLSQINELYNIFRSTGVYSILFPGINIPEIEEHLRELSGEAATIVGEAKENAQKIRDLIPEATATSLSVTLGKRTEQLSKRVTMWLSIVILTLLGTAILSWTFLTYNVGNEKTYYLEPNSQQYSGHITKSDSLDSTSTFIEQISVSNKNDESKGKSSLISNAEKDGWEFWLKRIIIFLPLFYLIIFSIRQYNKERKLLEIYTHKQSIAQTLPAYMEQALPSEETKSEILLRGSTMIFSLPENPDSPIQGSDGIAMNEVKTFLEIQEKLGRNTK